MLRKIRFLRRIGHRRSVLAGFGLIALLYGSGLVTGYRPTFASAYHYSTVSFGWTWIGLGLISLIGVPARRDAFFYAAAELGTVAWVLLLSTHWTQPNGWTAAVSWMGIALGLLLSSAWPNAPRPPPRVRPPPLPTLEELVTLPGEDRAP